MGATTVLNLASATRTTSGESDPLSVGDYTELAVSANITIVSGTTPTLTLSVEHLGADGTTYFPLWQAVITSATKISTSIGAGLAIALSFAGTVKFKWAITGTSPSFTFSSSIIAK